MMYKSDTNGALNKNCMASKRFFVSYLGEYYDDCLVVEAKLKNKTKANEAASLLSSKLGERDSKREKMVNYLAKKRNISYEEMWFQLLDPNFKLEPNELEDLVEEEE